FRRSEIAQQNATPMDGAQQVFRGSEIRQRNDMALQEAAQQTAGMTQSFADRMRADLERMVGVQGGRGLNGLNLEPALEVQGVGAWSSPEYRNGLDVQSDLAFDSRRSQEWVGQSDAIQARSLNEATQAIDQQALRRTAVEQQVHREILGEQAREDSVRGAQLFQTGGLLRGGAPRGVGSGGFEMVRNGNWDAALNIGADPYGVLPDMAGLQQDLGKLNRIQTESRINDMRQRMTDAGMKDVPEGYRTSLVDNGSRTGVTVRDYGATVDDLQTKYEGFVRDNRLKETWGENYQNLRLGKSQMTVLEFEKRVLDVQQKATDRAYANGVEAIARGDIAVKEGDYARTLGNYIDRQVRTELRFLAKGEGINDSMTSNLWGVNRSIRSDLTEGRGIPDNRLGYNLFADTTLAPKSGNTEQIMKWNAIRPDANYLIIRPSNMPGGGSYVIPRAAIQPFMPSLPTGRGL
ncbi:MAG: hypothetical protein ACT4NV_07255, partial [Rhodoferax sp.]